MRHPNALSTLLIAGALFGGSLTVFGHPQTPQTPPPADAAKPEIPAVPVPEPGGDGGTTFTEPIIHSAADPFIAYRNGMFYMTWTTGGGVSVRSASTLAGLSSGKSKSIWHGGGPGAEDARVDVWAPEMHFIHGRWYVYYCASDSMEKGTRDAHRRLYCLESKTDDALGEYTFKGKMIPPGEDAYEIDPTVYEQPSGGKLFVLWSGREEATGSAQNIYIAPLSDPWTISGPRVRLSTPEFDWEKHGWKVNEGPEVIERNGKVFVTYSASGYTTPNYCLGLLTNASGDLLNASAWKKSDHPVLQSHESPFGHLYATGHNGFFKSPDGKDDWIVFHARTIPGNTGHGRDAYAEPISALPTLDSALR